MPLTKFQAEIAELLAVNRSEDSHLAGGAALHFEPSSTRFSNDLDYFHDTVERVASAFAADEKCLVENGFSVHSELKQSGYVRATVSRDGESTKIEWAHDSAWRFMPVLHDKAAGCRLHPVDIAVNKVLALAGRDEPRDFLDVLLIHETVLPLGALCWAAVGKDAGFSPRSLLELLKRRGKYRPEDFKRLMLTAPVDLPEMKAKWLTALEQAESFIDSRPPEEAGCLYYSKSKRCFVQPADADTSSDIVLHHGRPGGSLPG